MGTATDPHRPPFTIPMGTPVAHPSTDVPVVIYEGGPVTEHTAKLIAEHLGTIAIALDKLANPPAFDPVQQIRESMRALKEEMPILGLVFDQFDQKARAAKGIVDVA